MPGLLEARQRWDAVKSGLWSMHETVVCMLLGIVSTSECTASARLATEITGIRRTYSINLQDSNAWRIRVTKHGGKERFPSITDGINTPTMRQPRWFGADTALPIQTQLEVLRFMQNQPGWDSWVEGPSPWRLRSSFDTTAIPAIAQQFCSVWPRVDDEGEDRYYSRVACSLRQLLKVSLNVLPSMGSRDRTNMLTADTGKGEAGETGEADHNGNPHNTTESLGGPLARSLFTATPGVEAAQSSVGLPPSLTLHTLRSNPDRLAAVELCLYLLDQSGGNQGEAVELLYARTGEVSLRSLPGLIGSLEQTLRTTLGAAVKEARGLFLGKIGRVLGTRFTPSEEQLLFDYLADGDRYSKGERLPVINTILHVDNSQPFCTDEAIAILRAIQYEFDISQIRFQTLICYFSVYFLRRTPTLDEFPSRRLLHGRFKRLRWIDNNIFAKQFSEWLSDRGQYGFQRLWYGVTDDSKHHKEDRHVVLASAAGAGGTPCYRHATSTTSGTKNETNNAKVNVAAYSEMYGGNSEILAFYNGGCADNAWDAQEEIRITHAMIMDITPLGYRMMYGVLRRPINHGDGFHIDNLAVTGFSMGAFGEYDREDYRAVHHRRAMQLLYDIVNNDRVGAQRIMDRVMNDAEGGVKLKVVKERQQRWLVNQRQAAFIMDALAIPDARGVPSLIAMCREMYEEKDSWVRRSAADLASMLAKLEIRLALACEADVGDYMETTTHWHKSSGATTRPGFRMSEIHHLYHSYIAPWWALALENPAERFKRAWPILQELPQPKRALYESKIKAGIQVAYGKIVKWAKYVMTAPIVFLLLRDPERGPPLCRALRFVLHVALYDKTKDARWGEFMYNDPLSPRPELEQKLVDLLQVDIASVVHWFQQVGLARFHVEPDLIKLSKATRGETPRKNFAKTYPVIDAALRAVFELMPSYSLLAEQCHGVHRQSLKSFHSCEFTDQKTDFIMNEVYPRRVLVRKRVRERSKELDEEAGGPEGAGRALKRRLSSVKLHDQKDDSVLQARLLQASLVRYDQQAVSGMVGLPHVRTLVHAGTMQLNREAARRSADGAIAKAARRTRVRRSGDEWKELAENMIVVGDISWEDPVEKQEKADLTRMLNFKFWESLKKPALFQDAPRTLILFASADPSLAAVATKKDLLAHLGTHLAAIKTILDSKQNTMSSIDITSMSREEAIRVFVDVTKCQSLLDTQESAGPAGRSQIEQVFNTCGTVCDPEICSRRGELIYGGEDGN